ncbi:zinc-binding dehydrogenase [Amycolatopsis magusensis]|uniref:zinc-binding dehydrogenase n=1 Tax=Amycolatopsis magusensis TaxID=882444 RepID=UPI0037BC477F
MHAMRLTAPAQFQTIHDAPIPAPAAGEVTVEFSAAALCGSDMPKFRATADPRSGSAGFPVHECVGRIADPGHHRDLTAGQRVLAMPADECGLAEIYRARRDATYAIRAAHLSDAQATLIQPLATVLYATSKLTGHLAGLHAVVIGLGPIGLLCAHILTGRGAHVTGIDPAGREDTLARAFGLADRLQDTSAAWATSRHRDRPVDLCVEAVGHQQRTLRDAITLTRHSGTILALGVPDDAEYALPYETLLRSNLTLITSITPPWQHWFGPAETYLTDHLDTLSLLLTHQFPVTAATQAYRTYAQPAHDRLKVTLTTTSGWRTPARLS